MPRTSLDLIPAGPFVVLPRRGLSRVEAAQYIGVSPSLFDDMVADGRMPRPLAINARRVWDMRALDVAFDALGTAAGAGLDDPWQGESP